MKVISHVIVLVVLLAAAYFTLEQRRLYTELVEKGDQLSAKNTTISANADAKEAELVKLKEFVGNQEQQIEVLQQSLALLKTDATDLQGKSAGLDATILTQEQELTELKGGQDEIAKILKDLGEDIQPEELGGKIEAIRADAKAQQTKLDELDTVIEGATNTLATTRTEFDNLVKREVERNARISRNSMESVVTAVNQDWGFLVIGAGSNSGFTPQSPLLIQRNGRYVGRVTPSAIEPTQTIAEIDLNSVASGVRIQPGDRVILSKPAAK